LNNKENGRRNGKRYSLSFLQKLNELIIIIIIKAEID